MSLPTERLIREQYERRRIENARQAFARAGALGRAARTETAKEKAQRYGQLVRADYTPQQACWELDVSRRTGHRYADRLNETTPEGTQ